MPSSPEIQAFATGFPVFLAHSLATFAILFVGAAIYVLLTPHKEITLIREGNSAAATWTITMTTTSTGTMSFPMTKKTTFALIRRQERSAGSPCLGRCCRCLQVISM